MEVDLDPSYNGIEGQGHRSRSNMKIVSFCLVLEKDRGQVKVTKIMSQGHHIRRQSQGGSRSVLLGGLFSPIDSREVRHAGVFNCVLNLECTCKCSCSVILIPVVIELMKYF